MSLSYAEMEKILMDALRLYHHPVAVNWLFTEEEIEEFRAGNACLAPVKPTTFCQWEIAARMQNKTVLATKDNLGCSNAQVCFGFKDNDGNEFKSQAKYCLDIDQAERFQRSKPRLPLGEVRAVAVGPLGKAATEPHVVHFYCDNMQSYHLAVDYMAATNTHPLRPQITMSSSACGGSVFTWLQKTFNCCPACSGSYNSGKTERGEVNVFIPGEQIGAVVKRLLQRIEKSGSSSITRPGDAFPGGDICKNCPLIVFKADACKKCEQ
ncbi:MAG: DUF169 domain-containing protein [Desulfovibrio sp.]|jgi:uncharacterized protein (DUF169 family)|nr:DUF169 domain-containing protein [Desulfovibrio sp.]